MSAPDETLRRAALDLEARPAPVRRGGAPQRVTAEACVSAYRTHGSVWKAAKALGIAGQSLWERLKRLGIPLQSEMWTPEEVAELRSLVGECTLGEAARRLGRPYHGVALKVSRLGIGTRFGNRQKKKAPRGVGLDKKRTADLMTDLFVYEGSLRHFCRSRGLDIETFVQAAQARCADAWAVYAEAHSDLGQVTCHYCGAEYFPMNKKQKNCTRKCAADERRDISYFGGKRRQTIGLLEGRCQLCGRTDAKGLSSHHVLGKENDPDNDVLIALCPGCHQVVGQLAGRSFIESPEGWENLIHLCMARRLAGRDSKFVGTHASVDIELLTPEEVDPDEVAHG